MGKKAPELKENNKESNIKKTIVKVEIAKKDKIFELVKSILKTLGKSEDDADLKQVIDEEWAKIMGEYDLVD